ncbi:hypothetical protein QBC47DRAFT_389037 [Echria macrotheca]|uniref:Uncharacterized protein n=1 Tax=Echria macrotheca TaxID=438768 RepID=A0AAJ0B6M9_9PEZI|nr:hypothetical protein QBC47DRAFT_389037 [Echria macrotheca]
MGAYRHTIFTTKPKQSPMADTTIRLVQQGVPYYQAVPVSYYQAYQHPSYQYQYVQQYNGASQTAVVKKPTPPRLSPLVIPYRPGPRPVCIDQPAQKPSRPVTQAYQYQRQPQPPSQRPQSQQPPPKQAQGFEPQPRTQSQPREQASHNAPQPPQNPPPRPPKIPKVEDMDEMDYFEFQNPCMLPPETISLGPRPQPPPSQLLTRSPAETQSPRYSLPILPSESGATLPTLQRSKPYLQSRRQKRRLSSRDSITTIPPRSQRGQTATRDELHGIVVAPIQQTAMFLPHWQQQKTKHPDEAELWYDFVEETGAGTEESSPTPIAAKRPETPLEYRAQQAAALHDLLGMVLGEEKKEDKSQLLGGDDAVGILEEEVELAARGYRKFSADEYLREIREVLGGFESPL